MDKIEVYQNWGMDKIREELEVVKRELEEIKKQITQPTPPPTNTPNTISKELGVRAVDVIMALMRDGVFVTVNQELTPDQMRILENNLNLK